MQHTAQHTHTRKHLLLYTTGVNPKRYLDGFAWDEFKWRRGELEAQFKAPRERGVTGVPNHVTDGPAVARAIPPAHL